MIHYYDFSSFHKSHKNYQILCTVSFLYCSKPPATEVFFVHYFFIFNDVLIQRKSQKVEEAGEYVQKLVQKFSKKYSQNLR